MAPFVVEYNIQTTGFQGIDAVGRASPWSPIFFLDRVRRHDKR